MFSKFTLPHLIDLSNHYGGIGIHCCANAMHQWDNFLKIPNMKLLNLVQPPEILKKAYKYFSNYTCQMHTWCGDGEPWVWPENYPQGSRIVIETAANDKNEAIILAEKRWKACGRAEHIDL